jgi:hypothetical protein
VRPKVLRKGRSSARHTSGALLRGTPRLNVPMRRTVFGVSGQCCVAVIGLKPIDRALTITSVMTAVQICLRACGEAARLTLQSPPGTALDEAH